MLEAETGDGRPMSGRRKGNGKGGGASGIIRKLKSLRNTPTNFSSDPHQTARGDNKTRPNSPAYSIESYATIEVGRLEKV